MKMAQYWESQEQRWHEKYLEAEQMIDQLESKVWNQASRIDTLEGALREIAEKDPRTSYPTYHHIARKALGGTDV